MYISWPPSGERGCSSVVERNLAKVDVESSNLFSRSIQGARRSPDRGRLSFLPPKIAERV